MKDAALRAIAGKVLAWLSPVLAVIVLGFGMLAVIVTAAAGSAPEALPGLCVSDSNLEPILATIRRIESADNYHAQSTGSTASGAYQIINGTWDRYGGYTRARDAPPAIQDAKAAEMVRAILDERNGDVSAVPIGWYLPSALDDPSKLDHVPRPDANNTLTIRQYQQRWLDEYARQQQTAALPVAGSVCSAFARIGNFGDMPAGLSNCAALGWGGYRNGHIPRNAMRHSRVSNHLHPAASVAFDELYAAAQAAGFDLSGNGYRPASSGGRTAGRSCHGVGLAVDIAVLTGNPDVAFASREFAWLCANGHRYGWVNPAWAMPVGMVCGPSVGNGRGGWIGNSCCHLEPWHVEAVGIVMTHPDFSAHHRRAHRTRPRPVRATARGCRRPVLEVA